MKVQYFIYLLFIIFIYLNIINISLCEEIQCGENTIKNCLKCDSSENSDTCSACEEKYFPFFNDILCLPCSDPLYGQVNCKGNCDNSNYVIDRNVKCEKSNCMEFPFSKKILFHDFFNSSSEKFTGKSSKEFSRMSEQTYNGILFFLDYPYY